MATQLNYISADKKLLITPELWLSDGNSSDHGPHGIMKCQKVKDSQGKSYSAEKLDSDHKSEFIRSDVPVRHSIQSKKRQKVDSIHENVGKSTKDINHDHPKSFLSSKTTKLSELNPHVTSQSSPRKLDLRQYMTNPPNLPLFFSPPWINPPSASNLPPFFLSSPHGQKLNFPIPKYPRPLSLPASSCPFLIPIPVPIPIPVLIRGDSKKDTNIQTMPTEAKPHKLSQASVQETEAHSPNQVIDFSFHKSRMGPIPLQELQPPESNPSSPTPPTIAYKIKTEPEEPRHVPLSSTFTQTPETRASYADRRSLILDAPPPTKINQAYNCLQAPRRLAHNRKRCYSVHVKTK